MSKWPFAQHTTTSNQSQPLNNNPTFSGKSERQNSSLVPDAYQLPKEEKSFIFFESCQNRQNPQNRQDHQPMGNNPPYRGISDRPGPAFGWNGNNDPEQSQQVVPSMWPITKPNSK